MNNKIATILVALSVLLGSSIALAQDENPFLGSWDIDFDESDFGNATVPKNLSRSYGDMGGGTYMYQVITINQDDTVNITSAHYTYSGEQYPISSFDDLPNATLISYIKINETTVVYTVHIGGEVNQIGAKFISPGYQRLTISIQFPNSDQENQILVFNRRT